MARRRRDIHYRVVTIADPGAGTEFSYTSPGKYWTVVKSLRAVLTTSAVAANRNPHLIARQGSAVFFDAGAGAVQAASTTGTYGAMDGNGRNGSSAGFRPWNLPTGGLVLAPGWELLSSTEAIDVDDDWSEIVMLVQEFDTDPTDAAEPTGAFYLPDQINTAP